jgi:hypothetical protein
MLYGKTSQAHSAAVSRRGLTLLLCSKRSQRAQFQYLDLADGQTPEWFEATELVSLGACLTPSITESPSVAVESFLSQVLQEDVPQKYSLSKRACEGILRRAEKRDKQLPPMLKEALMAQCRLAA